MKKVILGIVIALIGAFAIMNYLNEPKTAVEVVAQKRKEQGGVNAALNARKFVKKSLKSPSSAEFPPTSMAAVTETAIDTYVVSSYVDSQNGFGAMIRQNWIVEFRYTRTGQIELIDIAFLD